MSDRFSKPCLVTSDPYHLTRIHCHGVELGLGTAGTGRTRHDGDNPRHITYKARVLVGHLRKYVVIVLQHTITFRRIYTMQEANNRYGQNILLTFIYYSSTIWMSYCIIITNKYGLVAI